MVKEPVYHIWMQNWNSFFFLNHRLSSLLPYDFVLKYDDDQWPLESTIHQILLNNAKDNTTIIGERLFSVQKSFCGYSFFYKIIYSLE